MTTNRSPKVFRIESEQTDNTAEPAIKPVSKSVTITPEVDVFAAPAVVEQDEALSTKPSRGSFWGKLFWSALGGLVSLAIGLWFWRLVDELYRANPVMGWIGFALLGLAVLALLVILVREMRGLMRLGAATDMRDKAAVAFAADDGIAAKDVVRRLIEHQKSDTATAQQRAAMGNHLGEIIDGKGLLTLAERTLVQPQDELAKQAIASAAKRVSMVTAISPRALVDVLFVAAQSVMLTRRIAEIYGARPGALGFWRLGRRILSHLAITGGVALTDSVLSQLVGHGMAARLSAKLGEGVLNGLLTARVGLACIAACRPLPFLATDEPKLQDVAGEILSNPFGKKE
ncbi:MAG: YcjF family protein [Beijerinckiaceae bacterium]